MIDSQVFALSMFVPITAFFVFIVIKIFSGK